MSALPRFDRVQLDAELVGDGHDRLTKRALDTAPQEKPVVEPSQPASAHTDHKAVEQPTVGRNEVSLVMRIGHPALGTRTDQSVLSKWRSVIRSSTSRARSRTTMQASSPGALHREPDSVRTKPGQYRGQLAMSVMNAKPVSTGTAK